MGIDALQAARSVPVASVDNESLGKGARWVVFSFVFLFFSYIPVHGFLYAGWPIRPVVIFVLAAAMLAPYLYYRARFEFLASPIGLWALFYVLLTLTWFVLFGASAVGPLLQRLYAALFLVFSFGLISVHPWAVRSARLAVLWAVVLAVACNFYEFLNPTAFLPPGGFYGRAAGFYANPNLSGAAIVLGTIIGVGLVTARWRLVFLTMSLAGVILTLSRAAILGWFIAVGLLVWVRQVRMRSAVTSVAVIGAGAIIAWQFLLPVLLERTGVEEEILQERVGWFLERNATQDASSLEREHVAESAWHLFGEHPFLGSGLGSTEEWSDSASTHNMYLLFMADYGIIGALIFPLLVLSAVWSSRGQGAGLGLAFACFQLFWGLFSHNIVGEYYALLSLAIVAAWCQQTGPTSR
jgi:O-Antigen ligase